MLIKRCGSTKSYRKLFQPQDLITFPSCFTCHFFIRMETTFSLNGRALKLDNAEDMKEHTAAIEAMERVERVVLSGNTIGIGAAQELGKALAKLEHLKVNAFN